MKRLALAAAFLSSVIIPAAAHAEPVTEKPNQSYCEFIIIETPDAVFVEGFCIIFSDGSF